MDYASQLRHLVRKNEFFVGFDSDGCVFDTMEIKQKECFCPAFIKHFGLQAASKYAREVWQFVNLYSKTRGCNRYFAIQHAFRLISEWDVFAARGIRLGGMASLDAWLQVENKLGLPALRAKVESSHDADLARVLAWSVEVDSRIKDMVHGIPPFPGVKESLAKLGGRADMIVVSQTPVEALQREWSEHGVDGAMNYMAGQEAGTKADHIRLAAVGKYPGSHILMVGDALGDLKAAQANEALFYPIIPGQEEKSWQRFHQEAVGKFLAGSFAGAYQSGLIAEFDRALPSCFSFRL